MKVLDSYGIFESLGYTRRNRSVLEETDQIIHAGRDAGKEHIQKRDGSHGFYDYNRSGNDHRIMASFDPDTGIFSFSLFTVSCSIEMEGVGLMAARKMISLPSLMPPRIPPE